MKPVHRFVIVAAALASIAPANAAARPEPVVIGLHADMSAGCALGGEAIRRGALAAIAEINDRGGVLGGRPLTLVIQDHRGIPTRSVDQLPEFLREKNLVAILHGAHSPAIIQNLPAIHENHLIVLDAWAAATPVIDNGYRPNYVFRLSARDEFVGTFLVEQALRKGYTKLGLLSEKTNWGRSTVAGISAALEKRGKAPVAVEWFSWADKDMSPQLAALDDAGADVVLVTANPVEGAAIIQSMARRPRQKRLPLLSHWGITAGELVERAGPALREVQLEFLQTYSFLCPQSPRATALVNRYEEMFGAKDEREIFSPVGTAHAYDLVHLLALAIEKARTLERSKVRAALESLSMYRGVVRDLRRPFTPERHEALEISDYLLARYDASGTIVPAPGACPRR